MKIMEAAAKKQKKKQWRHTDHSCETMSQHLIYFIEMQFNMSPPVGKLVPAPGLKGIAGSLVEISLHGDSISCICIEVHDGVIIGNILDKSNTNQRDDRI